MTLVAIDPGPVESAWVLYDPTTRLPVKWGKDPNPEFLSALDGTVARGLAIEMVASYGMPVGSDVFETCVWAGRFIERWSTIRWGLARPEPWRVYRRDCKLHLCGSQQARDSNVRQALIDRYGPGREKAIGRKATPGPLYGMKADCWQALAVAITVAERVMEAAA